MILPSLVRETPEVTIMQKDSKPDIHLRPPEIGDAEAIARLGNNKKIWDNLRDYMPYPYSLDDAYSFIERISKERPPHTFAIIRRSELCGIAGFLPQEDIYRHSLEMGYWLGEPYWGRGIATSMLPLLLQYGFQELKAKRIFTSIFEHNIASQRLVLHAGFQKEGILRKAVIKNGQLIDEHRYGLLRTDHEAQVYLGS